MEKITPEQIEMIYKEITGPSDFVYLLLATFDIKTIEDMPRHTFEVIWKRLHTIKFDINNPVLKKIEDVQFVEHHMEAIYEIVNLADSLAHRYANPELVASLYQQADNLTIELKDHSDYIKEKYKKYVSENERFLCVLDGICPNECECDDCCEAADRFYEEAKDRWEEQVPEEDPE